jgi:hypothetical protein
MTGSGQPLLYELGVVEGPLFEMSAKDSPVGMRRVERQSDGSWKFAREAETD